MTPRSRSRTSTASATTAAELRLAGAGAAGIALPTLVSTLAISCVRLVEFLTGPSRFLFTPMALAVVYAMLASYAISRTLVPIPAACCWARRANRPDGGGTPACHQAASPASGKGSTIISNGCATAMSPCCTG
jgi:Cu/Ag efflux pump CusA